MAKHKAHREQRDQAGVGPDPRQITHLTPLRELRKFRVADGEPDIRGWPVYSSSGRKLGEVHDLLVDTRLNQVAMIHVEVEGTKRGTVAPIRAAWIDRDTKRVVLNEADFRLDQDVADLRRAAEPPQPAPASEDASAWRDVRYATDADADEVVVERRPVVMEEVVVRRRQVDPSELSAAERERLERDRTPPPRQT